MSSTTGQALCKTCAAGRKMINRISGTATTCQACSAGQFQDIPGRETCKDCPIGYYQNEQGIPYCVKCGAGTFGIGCQACAQGQWRGGSDPNATTCHDCGTGYYTDEVGQGTCFPCMPGQYNDETGATECKPCRKNTFSEAKHREAPCDQCAQGRTSKKGSTKCSDCAPGKFENTVNDEEICTECPIGFAQSETDASHCSRCTAGQEAPVTGSSFCALCDLGRFNNISGQHCSLCPIGQYQDGKGEIACKDCDIDTYSNEQGKASKADCIGCSADKSTGATTGNTEASACLCAKTDYYQDATTNECQGCPDGANCSDHNGMKLQELSALTGHWRAEHYSAKFPSCSRVYSSSNALQLAAERCCPASVNCAGAAATRNTTWHSDAQCLLGYRGVLCGECDENYVRIGDQCIPCAGGWQWGGAIASSLSTCVLVFLVSFALVKRTKTLKKHAPDKQRLAVEIAALLKILTSWLQIFSVLTKTFNSVPWGSSFTSYSQSSGTVVNLDLSFLSSYAVCSLSLPFLEQYALSAVYPIAITIAVKLGQRAAMINVKDPRRRDAQSAKGDKIFLLFIMLLFPSIANKSFTVFRCNDIPGLPYQVLDEDFSVKCFEAHHTMYVVIACITIAVCKCFFEYFFFSPLSR